MAALGWKPTLAIFGGWLGVAGLTVALGGLLGPGVLMNSGIVVAAIAAAIVRGGGLAGTQGLIPWMTAFAVSASVSAVFAINPWCGSPTWSSLLRVLVDRSSAQALWCGFSGLLDVFRGLLALFATATLLTTEGRRRWGLFLCVATVTGAAALGIHDYLRGIRYGGGYLVVRPFGNSNQSANFLAIGLAPVVALLVFSRKTAIRMATAGALALTGIAVLLAQSRAAWAGTFASVAGILWWAWGVSLRTVAAVTAAFALLLGFWLYASPKGIVRGIEGRLELWRPAIAVVRDHPWIGIGPRNFPYVDEQRYGVFDPWRHKQAHNLYLTLAAELGLIGLAAFLGLLAAVGAALVRVHGNLSGGLDETCWHAALGAWLALLVVGFGSMPYHSRTSVLFWAIIGIFHAQVAGQARRTAPLRPAQRVSGRGR